MNRKLYQQVEERILWPKIKRFRQVLTRGGRGVKTCWREEWSKISVYSSGVSVQSGGGYQRNDQAGDSRPTLVSGAVVL